MKQLGGNIRYYREKLGWTQQELAEQINVSRPVLTRWENGNLIPDLEALVQLSQIFNTSLDLLIGHVQHKNLLLREAKKIYRIDEEADEDILEIIRYLKDHPDLKQGLWTLSQMVPKKRKPIEKMLQITLRDLVEAIK